MINEKIRQIRIKNKISQYELADETKIFNQSQISKIEKGLRRIKTEDLPIIAKALGVTVEELIKAG